jgi:hypothetical protein
MADALTVLAIREADTTSDVCRRCAKCCEIELRVANTDSRYRRFLRGMGLQISPPVSDGKEDCCDQVHEVTVHLGPCRYLRSEPLEGQTLYSCALYGDARRPQLCEQYNCVSWAKANNAYHVNNQMLAAAQTAWAALECKREEPIPDPRSLIPLNAREVMRT